MKRISKSARWQPDRQGCPASAWHRGHWVVVVLDFFVVVISPVGVRVVPLE
jgi:hypothetical protein